MLTKSRGLVAPFLLALHAACSEPSPIVDDQSWDDLSTEQRYDQLRTKVDDSLETLRTTADAQEWHTAAGEAVRGLSLLRAEGGLDDREAYIELELEVERLTDAVPFFAEQRSGRVEGVEGVER